MCSSDLDDERIAGEVLGEALDVGCLDREVELALERARELRGDLRRLITAGFRDLGLDQAGDVKEQAQVGLDLRADARPANLEHDRRAILQLRAMDLRDGSRAMRLRV